MTDTTTQNGTTKPVEVTIKVLTAEVRTLMVGSRQVTLSVFNQLDWVKSDAAYITPMGRINYRANRTDMKALIGADPTGILVATQYPSWPGNLTIAECCERNEVGRIVEQPNGRLRLKHDGAEFILRERVAPDYCPDPFAADLPEWMKSGSETWRKEQFFRERADDLETHRMDAHWTAQELKQRQATWSRALQWWEQAESMPLIVLAGLR